MRTQYPETDDFDTVAVKANNKKAFDNKRRKKYHNKDEAWEEGNWN